MLDSWSANGTVAKIKYIHGRMFTKENYHEMLMRRTVPEAADYLAHSARYKDAFRDVDPNTVHRGFVEALLQRENFNTYMRLCRFQELDKLPFYDFLIKSKEIECILSMIKVITSLSNVEIKNTDRIYFLHIRVDFAQINMFGNSLSYSIQDSLQIIEFTSILNFDKNYFIFTIAGFNINTIKFIIFPLLITFTF